LGFNVDAASGEAEGSDFQSGPEWPEHGKCTFAMRHFHEPAGSDDSDGDPAGWSRASYQSHPVDILEPLPDDPNPYRIAAMHYLEIMFAIDRFVEGAEDARLAIIVVGVVFGWPSTRGLSIADIASQIGCSPLTITRAGVKFREMAGLGVPAGCGWPGAGSLNGETPAAVQSVGN
jgi:hypothetical protein